MRFYVLAPTRSRASSHSSFAISHFCQAHGSTANASGDAVEDTIRKSTESITWRNDRAACRFCIFGLGHASYLLQSSQILA